LSAIQMHIESKPKAVRGKERCVNPQKVAKPF
jgi:hypothetical protein